MKTASKKAGKKNATLELMPDEHLPLSNNNNEINNNGQPFLPSSKKTKAEDSRAIAENELLAHAPAIANNDVESSATRLPHDHQEPFVLPGAYRSDGGYSPRHSEEEDMYTITNTNDQQATPPMPTVDIRVQARLVEDEAPDVAPDGNAASSSRIPNDGFPVIAAAKPMSWMSNVPLGAWFFVGILVLVIGVVVGVVTVSGGGDPPEPTSNAADIVPSTPATFKPSTAPPSTFPTFKPTTMIPTPVPTTQSPESIAAADLQIACSWIGVADIDVCQNTIFTFTGAGSIPTQLGMLTELTLLHLANNELTGSIPTHLGMLTQLTALYLSYNELTGSIPTHLGMLKQLTALYLSYNELTGSIPTQLGMLTQLSALQVYSNGLTGSIPIHLGILTQLTLLTLTRNKLAGSIPTHLGMLTQLTLLDFFNNELTGSVPTQLGMLTELNLLSLFNNTLTGSIPTQLGILTDLVYLSLSSNGLTGSIPTQLGMLTQLTKFGLYSTGLTGSMPESICVTINPRIDCGEIACSCCRDADGGSCP